MRHETQVEIEIRPFLNVRLKVLIKLLSLTDIYLLPFDSCPQNSVTDVTLLVVVGKKNETRDPS